MSFAARFCVSRQVAPHGCVDPPSGVWTASGPRDVLVSRFSSTPSMATHTQAAVPGLVPAACCPFPKHEDGVPRGAVLACTRVGDVVGSSCTEHGARLGRS